MVEGKVLSEGSHVLIWCNSLVGCIVSNRSTCWKREEDGCYRPSVPVREERSPSPTVRLPFFSSSSSSQRLTLHGHRWGPLGPMRSRKQLFVFYTLSLRPFWVAKNINEGRTSSRFIWIRKMYEMHNSGQIIPPVLSKGFVSLSLQRDLPHITKPKGSYCCLFFRSYSACLLALLAPYLVCFSTERLLARNLIKLTLTCLHCPDLLILEQGQIWD